SGGRALGAGIAFTGNAEARAVSGARRNTDFDHFSMGGPAVASAGRAGVAQFARAAAARASEIELHGPRHLADVAAAFTLRTSDFPKAAGARPVASAADLIAGNVDSGLGAFYGLPEIDVHHVLEVAAFFRLSLRAAALAAEKLREN